MKDMCSSGNRPTCRQNKYRTTSIDSDLFSFLPVIAESEEDKVCAKCGGVQHLVEVEAVVGPHLPAPVGAAGQGDAVSERVEVVRRHHTQAVRVHFVHQRIVCRGHIGRLHVSKVGVSVNFDDSLIMISL